jgi:hypothetical protein
MAIFAVIQQPSANSARLGPKVLSAFPTHLSIGSGVWLVAAAGTAQDVSTKLEILPTEQNGAAVVLEVASYFGRANPAIWSWIKTNWEGRAAG